MQFLILALFFCLFVFLFCLYTLAYEDIILIRRKIATEQLFDTIFIIFIIGILSARVTYIAFHFKPGYLHPLVFFLFPYFPGLSLIGGILGGVGSAYLLLRSKKMPFPRLIDMFSISFLAALPFGYLFPIILSLLAHKHILTQQIILPVFYFFIFLFFVLLLFPYQKKNEIKEGSITLVMLLMFSVSSIFFNVINHAPRVIFVLGFDDIICLFVFFVSFVLLLKQENIIKLPKKARR